MNDMTNEIRSKIKGCLMGGALGDALGYEVEFLPWSMIQAEYGEKGIQQLVRHDGWARFSDDTQMTLFTCEGIALGLQRRAMTLEASVYQSYLCWLQTQYPSRRKSMWAEHSQLLKIPQLHAARAPGNTCLSALESGEMGTVDESINHSKGCGGVMRAAPMGFLPFGSTALENGAACAAITHGHPGGWAPAGMLADLVQRCLYGNPEPLETKITASLQAVREKWTFPAVENFAQMVAKAIELSRTDQPEPEAIHSIGGGWVGDECMAIAVYSCLKHPDDVKAALICAVNHSGDSDSTGSVAGNILGAYHGYDRLPKDWISQLECTDVIAQQAQNIADRISEHQQGI